MRRTLIHFISGTLEVVCSVFKVYVLYNEICSVWWLHVLSAEQHKHASVYFNIILPCTSTRGLHKQTHNRTKLLSKTV